MKKIRTIEASVLEFKRIRVCAYVRVSTDQVEQQESFSAQVQYYTAYINSNPAWSFAGIYADQGISGKSKEKRPEFLRMVKYAENKKSDLIITKSISRFARNKIDTLETVRKLKSIGIGIYFERENINSLTAESELMLSILSSVAEEELVSMSQNMRWSNQRRFNSSLTARPPKITYQKPESRVVTRFFAAQC
ncbi:MAG: recombinase family protein [Armatimonadota bacterium]|nr:recombinase family protein [Armatimonadota bacterium]